MQTLWNNAGAEALNNAAEEALKEALIKRAKENFHSFKPPMPRQDSFDGTNVPLSLPYLLYSKKKEAWSRTGSYYIPSLAPSLLNSPLPSHQPSRKNSFEEPLPDLFDGLGETNPGLGETSAGLGKTNPGETDPKDRLNEIRQKVMAAKLQNAWRERLKEKEEKRRQEEEARKKEKEEEEKRLREQKDKEEQIKRENERIEREKERAQKEKSSPGGYHPDLYSRVHSELHVPYGYLKCTEVTYDRHGKPRKDNEEWYSKLPFKDFALFVTETNCTGVDFSGIGGYASYAENYLKDPEGLKMLSGMALKVAKHTGEQEDNPYKKVFGDGFWKRYFSLSDPNDFTEIVTAAQPSKITFVHEKLSGHNWYINKSWSKEGYRLVWNRYAKQFSKQCDKDHWMKVFADEVATAAKAISGAGAKWVDFTVFRPFDGELRSNLTKALLERGIDVLDYEENMSKELLAWKGEGYRYGGDYVRYLKGKELSKDRLQEVQKGIEISKRLLLSEVEKAKAEHTVKEHTLYMCSVEEVIKAADENKSLTKLILPWRKCEGLYPLEGNLTAALGAIANTKSEHEWTIVLEGVADNNKEQYTVSRELQESISMAIGPKAGRRCCYNPIEGTISVVKKGNFPTEWKKAMEACIARDTWVYVYKHDLEVPGFDFVAPAMTVRHHWNTRGYCLNFEADDIEPIVKAIAGYVSDNQKVHEEAYAVRFIVRGAGITTKKLEEAMEEAIGKLDYWNQYAGFFSFEEKALETDKEGNVIKTEPDAAVIVLKARRFALGKMASLYDTIAIDPFDAKDKDFCGYGFYEVEHAELRTVRRLVLPKGEELDDKQWQELTNSLWFYFFSKKFKDLIFESDEAGCKKLKACAENNRKNDPYPWRGAYGWTFESTDNKNELRIISWSDVYERQKEEFLKNVGTSHEVTELKNYTWLDKEKLADIVLHMSKSDSKGRLHVAFDTGGALANVIRKLLENTSVAKRDGWVLETSEDIDLAPLLPYMKTYFAIPLGKREILFVKSEAKCKEYASKMLEGRFKDFENEEAFVIEPYFARFCMKEVLEAAAAAESKVKMLKVNIDESNAEVLKKTLLDFCKTVPVKREPFILRLVAPSFTGEKLLEEFTDPFCYDWQQSLASKSIIMKKGWIDQLNDKGKRVYVLGHYEVSLRFMSMEDFFIKYYINEHISDGIKEIDKSYDALPTQTLFDCMNDKQCRPMHFEVLRDMTKKDVIDGIKSMLANQKDGRTGFTVRFASEGIAKTETVKEIADAVSKLNDPKNNRFVVPMYKDNLFLFVDKDGWARKDQMAKNDGFEYKEKPEENRLRELLFLMSLPTSKAPTLALTDYRLNESSLKLILDHGNRTGWSLMNCYMRCSAKGKSMCCLSITNKPYTQLFLNEKKFEEGILKEFKKEEVKSLKEDRKYDLGDIFNYKASYWGEKYGRGFVSLASALKFAEQLKSGYQTLKLKENFDYMNRNEEAKAAKFIEWIKEGLQEICNDENSGQRNWYLSLENLSEEQREQITKLKLGKGAKRELVFTDGDEGALDIGTRKPFAQRLTKEGTLEVDVSDLRVSTYDEVLMSANRLRGLKKLEWPNSGNEEDVAEAVEKVLKSGLNKTWKQITFPSGWGDIDKIAKEINEEIKDDLPYKVEGKIEDGTGVLILKDLHLPTLTTEEQVLILRPAKAVEENKKVQRLAITDTLETWFKDNKENRHTWEDFTEALAERPQIQYVDFTCLKDENVHKLYGTIDQWARLLYIPGTVFKFNPVQSESGDKNVASYNNLEARKDVTWHLDKKSGKVRLFENKSMCMKPTNDKIAVTRKWRLLWNRTALERLFNIRSKRGKGGKTPKLLNDDEAGRVDCIDFTIGDPKVKWTTSDGKKTHNWGEVWDFVGSKNFLASLPEDVTIRVYDDCLSDDNRAFLSKNSKDFKYVGKQNGKQMVEITLCSDDAFSTAGETDADDEDDERETKRKRLKKQTREEEEAMERDW